MLKLRIFYTSDDNGEDEKDAFLQLLRENEDIINESEPYSGRISVDQYKRIYIDLKSKKAVKSAF